MLPRRALFGISLVPEAANHAQLVEWAQRADASGLDFIGIQDHPYQRRFLDTFQLIADLLARTQRVSIFPDVASLPMRGPTMIAKAAASLDVMSGGRFELGLGAGNFWDAVAGMGGPHRTSAEAADALEEAISIIRGALDVGPERRVVRGDGHHYPVPGYPPGPPPAHRIELWIGAYRPRALRLIGRVADGWVPSHGYLPPHGFRVASARIDAAAREAGRDPALIRRLYNFGGAITDDGGQVGADLDGPVRSWIDRLIGWRTDLGVDGFVFWAPDQASLERYAGEVVPAARAALGE
jgi:alkanesulfonate monooxygenase SsuD/methylene tetrahydromethanopterin reductase-like flavin-dependent oxidoreductase (luciferase family)